jgi:hypothetical protein
LIESFKSDEHVYETSGFRLQASGFRLQASGFRGAGVQPGSSCSL